MILSIFLLIVALFLVIKSAQYAILYSTRLAESFHIPKYIIGFLIIAVISILPETFIGITSAIEGVPAFGLGTLFGSNVADLTLVFAIVIFLSRRNLTVESKLIKNRWMHIGIITLPIVLGLNGYYSRLDGAVLLLVGVAFYYILLKKNAYTVSIEKQEVRLTDFLFLFVSMGVLLFGAHMTVTQAVHLAEIIHIPALFIGMFLVGLGTVLPELIVSLEAAKKGQDSLALGDILGTVIADATIVVGIMALVRPFAFPPRIIFITGVCMVLAMVVLFYFMKSGKVITKKEAFLLLLFYVSFVLAEVMMS